MDIHITVGLPGSGKTTWAKKSSSISYNRHNYLDCDLIKSTNDLLERIENYITSKQDLYIDGLFLNNKIIETIIEFCENNKNKIGIFYIHYWEPDIEACLWNDKYRRAINSKITIKNAKIDFNYKELKDKFKGKTKFAIDIQTHEIMKTPKWKKFATKLGYSFYTLNGESPEFRCESWSNGGTWRDCWGSSGNVSSSSPSEPNTFDDLLLKVVPNINFLLYKKHKSFL
jgi:hypothetical protein